MLATLRRVLSPPPPPPPPPNVLFLDRDARAFVDPAGLVTARRSVLGVATRRRPPPELAARRGPLPADLDLESADGRGANASACSLSSELRRNLPPLSLVSPSVPADDHFLVGRRPSVSFFTNLATTPCAHSWAAENVFRRGPRGGTRITDAVNGTCTTTRWHPPVPMRPNMWICPGVYHSVNSWNTNVCPTGDAVDDAISAPITSGSDGVSSSGWTIGGCIHGTTTHTHILTHGDAAICTL